MSFQQHELAILQEDRFEQVKRLRCTLHEAGLVDELRRLACNGRVASDAAADAEACRALRPVPVDPDTADANVETRCTAGLQHADGTAIGTSRRALQVTDRLHRFDLGRTRDRAARKQRTEHIRERQAWPKLRTHRGGHRPHRRQCVQLEQVWHLHRMQGRNPRQIVPQQVDDHQVFGALLGGLPERVSQSRILFRGVAPRCGALHRLRRHGAVAQRKEQLG